MGQMPTPDVSNVAMITGIVFVLGVCVLITIIIVVVVWQLFGTWRARASLAREEAYRKLVEDTASAQRQIAGDLSDLRARVETIEKLLREVA